MRDLPWDDYSVAIPAFLTMVVMPFTFSITDDQKIGLGIALGNHVHLLRQNKMLPLPTLFAVDHKSPYYNEKSKMSIFYAQSWALMHYLIIGKEGQLKKLTKFLEMIAADVPVETAFTQAFETTFDAMEKELHAYVRQDRYNYEKGQLAEKLEREVEELHLLFVGQAHRFADVHRQRERFRSVREVKIEQLAVHLLEIPGVVEVERAPPNLGLGRDGADVEADRRVHPGQAFGRQPFGREQVEDAAHLRAAADESQVPEVARTIGSSAVTRPLAGRWISITLSLRRVWM